MNKDTWHHAIKSNGPLANEVLANRVMIPDQEAHQRDFWHVHSEDQGLLPHGVEPWIWEEEDSAYFLVLFLNPYQ